MSLKLKALSLGLLAALALSAVAVTNAGATRSGHFTSDSTTQETTTLIGSESTHNATHRIEFSAAGLPGNPIYCTHASFHGTVNPNTTQEIRVKPTYSVCTTTNTNEAVTVDVNGCEFAFTSRTEPGDATAGLSCPAGKKVQITDPASGCTLSFGTQKVANAVTYGTDTATTGVHTKHSITLNATAKNIAYTAHGGLCIFVGTNRTDGSMTGSATVKGVDLNGTLVNITAT
jgi:hypothetical protein